MIYVGLTTIEFDLDGFLVIFAGAGTELSSRARRVNRVPTTNGKVFINDGGFVHGDRTFRITARMTQSDFDKAASLLENNTELLMSIAEGVFVVSPQDITVNSSRETEIQLLCKEKQ